ncbi:hypothetical protein BHE74_00023912 [Ensete ventricosum]|nr:hypothetical protein BHE74_00023912 [Ensete ventricosum]RZR99326.1 hypothetical protein BHM03_00028841 [Ensete ventricosum]
MTACEVLLFHHEDMGIPWEIAKLGVRQGMWGCVKKIEPGLRAYQAARRTNEPPSRFVFMAQINSKIDAEQLRSFEISSDASADIVEPEKQNLACSIPKILLVGGAVAMAYTLDHGLLTKAVIFGVVRSGTSPGVRYEFTERIGKLARNTLGDHRTKTVRLTARMPEATGLVGIRMEKMKEIKRPPL